MSLVRDISLYFSLIYRLHSKKQLRAYWWKRKTSGIDFFHMIYLYGFGLDELPLAIFYQLCCHSNWAWEEDKTKFWKDCESTVEQNSVEQKNKTLNRERDTLWLVILKTVWNLSLKKTGGDSLYAIRFTAVWFAVLDILWQSNHAIQFTL